jgi:hypothetical protein
VANAGHAKATVWEGRIEELLQVRSAPKVSLINAGCLYHGRMSILLEESTNQLMVIEHDDLFK